MTEIAERYTRIALIDEGPAVTLSLPYAEDQYGEVDLSAAPIQRGREYAVQLELLYLGADGVEEGIPLSEAVSEAVVTCSGTPGTVIAAGKRVKVAGSDWSWALLEAVTIGEGGTVDGTFIASSEAEADAHEIDTIVDAVSGWASVDNSAESSEGEVWLPITLRLYDRRTHRIVHQRDTLTMLSATDTRYQITPDANQDPRSTGEVLGYAGRMVLRWADDDTTLPPVGRWDWELTVSYLPVWEDRGDRVEARGIIEVLP